MPNTFARADLIVVNLAKEIIERFHHEIYEVEAKIDFVFAFRDPEAEEPAIMVRGHRVLGQARVNNLKHRALGLGDCEVLLDGDAWENMPEPNKRALLDHELEHFEIKRHKKTGEYLYDDLHRPLMKLRDHDREFGFFDNIAQRHGADSWEVKNLKKMFEEAGGAYIPGILRTDELEEPTRKGLSALASALLKKNP